MCKCGNESRPGQRTCKECHSAYMREWRKEANKALLQREEKNLKQLIYLHNRVNQLENRPAQYVPPPTYGPFWPTPMTMELHPKLVRDD